MLEHVPRKVFTTMRAITYLYPLVLVLSLSPLAQAADMTSPSYQIKTGETPAGGGAAASPNYSSKTSAIGDAIDFASGSSSPRYRLTPALLSQAAKSLNPLPSGDIDGDGSVTLADALLALQISVSSVAATGEQLKNGDVAPFVGGRPVPDGIVTVADALFILRRVIKLVNW
jgi:hypothetical protein